MTKQFLNFEVDVRLMPILGVGVGINGREMIIVLPFISVEIKFKSKNKEL
tara:strand:- start:104 stop:253 length:150 start_codon:yes stop_codon:yes gene_type:complete